LPQRKGARFCLAFLSPVRTAKIIATVGWTINRDSSDPANRPTGFSHTLVNVSSIDLFQ
jgi:hypothetical protein